MAAVVNGVSHGVKPLEVSFPLPNALVTRVHVRVTNDVNSVMVLLTTSEAEASAGSSSSMGAFVYAMPHLSNPATAPLTTCLLPQPSSQDFATRIAAAIARKTKKPTYVGSSVSFASTGLGGTVEEEMRGLSRCVEVVKALIDGRVELAEDSQTPT